MEENYYQAALLNLKQRLAAEERQVISLKATLAESAQTGEHQLEELGALAKARRELEERMTVLRSENAALELKATGLTQDIQRAQQLREDEQERFTAREADLQAAIEIVTSTKEAAEQEVIEKETLLKNTKLELDLELAKTQGLQAEISNMQAAHSATKGQVSQLETKLEEQRLALGKKDEVIASLEADGRSQVANLVEQKATWSNHLEASQKEVEALRAQLAEEKNRYSQLQSTFSIRAIELEGKASQYEGARLAGQKLNERLVEIQSELEQTTSNLEQRDAQVKTLEDSLLLMKERLNRVTVLACQRGNDLSDQLSEDEINSVLREYEEKDKQTRSNLNQVRCQRASLVEMTSKFKAQQETIKKLLDKHSIAKQEIENVRKTNTLLQRKSESDSASISTLQERLMVRQKEFGAMKLHYVLLEQAIAGQANSALVRQIQEEINKQAVDSNYQEVLNKELDLVKQCDDLRFDIATARKETCALSAENRELRAELKKTTKAIQSLSSEKKKFMQDADMADANLHPSTKVAADLKVFEASLSAKMEEIFQLKTELTLAKQELTHLKSQKQPVPAPIVQKEDTSRLEMEINSLKQQLAVKVGALQTLQSKLEAAESDKSHAERHLAFSQSQIAKLKETMDSLLQENSVANSQLLEIRVQKEQIETSLKAKVQSMELDFKKQLADYKLEAEASAQTKAENSMRFDIQLQNSQISNQLLKNQLKRAKTKMASIEASAADRDHEMSERPSTVMDAASLEKEELGMIIKEMMKDHRAQLTARDKMIDQLQCMFREIEEKKTKAEAANEKTIKDAIAETQSALEFYKFKLTEEAEQKKAADAKIIELTAEVQKLKQDANAQLITSQTASHPPEALSSMALKQKAESLEHDLTLAKDEVIKVNLAKEEAQLQLETLKESSSTVLKALQEEIEALKAQIATLRVSNQQLSAGLEEQKRANLNTSPSGKSEQRVMEEEVRSKLEQQVTQLQNEKFVEVQKQTKLQKELFDKEVQLKRKDQEIGALRSQISSDKFSAAQMKDLNAQLRTLQAQYDAAVIELQKVKQNQHEGVSNSKETMDLREQLKTITTQFDELVESCKLQKAELQAPPTVQAVFVNFFKALKRSKTLVDLVIDSLNSKEPETVVVEDEEVKVGMKRQKPNEA